MLVDLIRHGETEMPGCLLGRSDPLLSERGWEQLRRQTQGRNWARVICSPRRRTRLFAEWMAMERNLPLAVGEEWSELDFGEWDGRIIAELAADASTRDALALLYQSADARPPGGESWLDLQRRVGRGLDSLLEEPAQQSALVVAHAGPMRAALALSCGIEFSRLWALRIVPATRITLRIGSDAQAGLWGEIIEVVQP